MDPKTRMWMIVALIVLVLSIVIGIIYYMSRNKTNSWLTNSFGSSTGDKTKTTTPAAGTSAAGQASA